MLSYVRLTYFDHMQPLPIPNLPSLYLFCPFMLFSPRLYTESIMHLSFWAGLISPNTVNSISITFIFLRVDVSPTSFAEESTFSLACIFGTLWEIWWLQPQVFISRPMVCSSCPCFYSLVFLVLLLWFSSIFYNQVLSFQYWSFNLGFSSFLCFHMNVKNYFF